MAASSSTTGSSSGSGAPPSHFSNVPQDVIVNDMVSNLDPIAIGRLAQVSKSFNNLMQNPKVWQDLSTRERIPRVMSSNGQPLDDREHFGALYQMRKNGSLITDKMISEVLDVPMTEVPFIREDVFNRLNNPDRFEPKKTIENIYNKLNNLINWVKGTDVSVNAVKSIRDNYVIIVVPPVSTKEFSERSLQPKKGKENMPVFHAQSLNEAFNDTRPVKAEIWLMRKNVAEGSRFKTYDKQEEFVRSQGFEVTTFRVRAFYDAYMLLTTGTCPDDQNPDTYARTADTVHFCNKFYHLIVGGFAPGAGMYVSFNYNGGDDSMGVVPGVPAEVPGPLAIDKGH